MFNDGVRTVVEPVGTAYEMWSRFYDADNEQWDVVLVCRAFHELAVRYSAPGPRLLDLGCGTGTSTFGFATLGYQVTGCDVEPAMMRIAMNKPGGDRVRFQHADLRDLPDMGLFDVATAVQDPLSHLLTDEDFAAALRGIARVLAPGGLLIFDQRTDAAYRRAEEQVTVSEDEHQFLVRRAWQDDDARAGRVLRLRLDRFVRTASGWRRLSHEHFLRHRSDAEIRRLVADAELETVAVRGLTHDGILHEITNGPMETILYVIRKL